MSVTLKIQFQDELRRLSISRGITWTELNRTVLTLFPALLQNSFTIKYADQDGDLITLSTDLELNELISLANSSASPLLRLQVFPIASNPVLSKPNIHTKPAPIETAQNPAENPKEDATNPAPVQPKQVEDEETFESPSEETLTQPEEELEEHEGKDKGKEKIDENAESQQQKQEDEKKKEEEEEEEEETPSLEEILGGFQKLGEHVEEILKQHPEIQERAEELNEQLRGFFVKEIERKRKAWQEFHQRQEQIRQERLREYENYRAAAAAAGFPGSCFFARSVPAPSPSPCSQFRGPQSQHCGRRFDSGNSGCGGFRAGGIVDEKLKKLEEMGFIDRELNLKLLRKNLGDLHQTLEDLQAIQSQDL